MLDPNRTLDDRFRNYLAVMLDGLTHTGILTAETATSVTLVEQQAKSHVLLRSELEVLTMSKTSLMPEGFERELAPADLNDLIAYLTTVSDTTAKALPDSSKVVPVVSAEPPLPSVVEISNLVEQIVSDSAREYEHIPRIWEIAIEAGRRNNSQELTQLLALALPPQVQPIANWQVVLLGGGVVNGLSEIRVNPAERVSELRDRAAISGAAVRIVLRAGVEGVRACFG